MTDSNNILNRPFGLNIRVPERTIQQVQETAGNAINIFSPIFNYLDENDKVFSGDVAKEIDKYNRLTYALGATARANKPEINFEARG